jgi:hypothetical protein
VTDDTYPTTPHTVITLDLLYRGYPVRYAINLFDETDPVEAIDGVIAWAKANGAEPLAPAPAASARAEAKPAAAPPQRYAPRQAGGGTQYRQQPARNGGGYARPDDDWVCPVHGDEALGPGYQGRGLECKVQSDEPEEWTKDKPFIGKDGVPRYYCKYRS